MIMMIMMFYSLFRQMAPRLAFFCDFLSNYQLLLEVVCKINSHQSANVQNVIIWSKSGQKQLSE